MVDFNRFYFVLAETQSGEALLSLTQLAAELSPFFVDSSLVKVSVADTTAGFLNTKLTVDASLTKSITSPAGNERLQLAVVSPFQFKNTAADTTPSYLDAKLTVTAASGLIKTTVNPGANESTNIAIDTGVTNGDIPQITQSGAGVDAFPEADKLGITTGAKITATLTGLQGEHLGSSLLRSAPNGLATGVAETLTSISLTPGDWDISGAVGFLPAATTVLVRTEGSISLTTNTTPSVNTTAIGSGLTGEIRMTQNYPSGYVPTADVTISIPSIRVRITATTTFYLVAEAGFSVSTVSAYGSIWARRVR